MQIIQEMNRARNTLRGSQIPTNRITKENSYASKYKAILQNVIAANPQKGNRPFRNITNLYPGLSRGQNDENAIRKLQRLRNARQGNNLNSQSVINQTNSARQANNITMIVPMKEVESKPKANPQECEEYTREIDQYLLTIEDKYPIDPDYMSRQKDINTTMRAILVDWLIDVHIRFKLVAETLFLTVNILDRYLQKVQVKRDTLQLIGVTAALISCKYGQ